MTLVALLSTLQGPIGGRILDVLVFAAAGALAYRLPRAVPYVAVFAVCLQSNLTHTLTSDGDALAGLCVGLAIGRLESRRPVTKLRMSPALVALTLLSLLVVLSYVANSNGPNGHQVALGTEYFISRSLLAAAVVLLSDDDPDWQFRWSQAIGLLVLVLALFRLSEVVGLPVKSATDALGMSILGEYADTSNANLYAVLLGFGIPLLLADAGRDSGRLASRTSLRWIAAAIVTFAMASTASRTGAVIIVGVIVALLILASNARRRIGVSALAAVYLVGSFLPALPISQRPIVVTSGAVPDSAVATNQQPLVAPPAALVTPPVGQASPRVGQPPPPQVQHQALPAMRPQWRAVLDRNYYQLEQTLPPPTSAGSGHYIVFSALGGGGGIGVTLLVSVNATLIARIRPSDMTVYYQWHEVAIPDGVLEPGMPVTVDFAVAGSPDSTRDYFIVGGINARSNGYRSRIWTGESWSESDLSSDPGAQSGLYMIFVDGVIPALTYLQVSSSEAIDTSVEDRLILWRTALNAFEHNPLFGTGFYTFGLVRRQYQPIGTALFYPYANAHSNYFQLLSDLGWAGPLFFMLIFILPFARLTRMVLSDPKRNSWLPPALALACGACLISSLTQTWIADSRFYVLSWFLALVAGVAIRTSSEERHPLRASFRPTMDAKSGRGHVDVPTPGPV